VKITSSTTASNTLAKCMDHHIHKNIEVSFELW